MSASEHESLPFNLPVADLKRQAVDVWRGFEYQLLQALHAWLRLPEHASLYLEVAEDHAILDGTQIEQTQVKDLASNITLRSDAARALLESHWRLVEANPTLDVVSILLTTAKAGKEANITFPDNKPGLEHWRIVARDGTQIKPLRDFLLTLEFSEGLNKFIKEAPDEEFRRRLIRPVKWACSSGDLEAIHHLVNESLIYLGDRYTLLATESVRTLEILLAELRTVILRKSIRRVTRADLLQAFERATHVSVPRAVADGSSRVQTIASGQLAINTSTGVITDLSRIPLPPRVASRSELVIDMSTLAANKGVLWMYGSSGLGKTTLALMMGKHTKEPWLFVDLRGCSVQEVKHRLVVAGQNLAAGVARGVIVDDYPLDQAQSTLLSIAQLRMEAYLQDAIMVLTTTRVPPPTVVSRLGEADVELTEIPYLSKDDVKTLITEAGGDSKKWTEIVHLFSGGGHPQLVDAKIVSLRNNNWADSELHKDVAPIFASKEVQAEKDAVSLQLPKLIPENALELLYRLSLLMNGFDRQLAMSVANSKEPIKRPGEAFMLLIGPWVERRGDDKFSLSPLVSNCGGAALSGEQQSLIRKSIVRDLMQRHPFPAEQLTQLLLNAYAEREKSALLWFAEAMQLSAIRDRREFKLLAREVSIILTSFPVNESMFPNDNYVAAMLRIVQCFVSLETEPEKFSAIFDRMIEECRQVADKQVSAGLLVLCIFKILSRQGIGLSPKKWLPLIMEFPQLIEDQGERGKSFAEAGKDNPQGWSIDQFLFVVQASTLSKVDWLSELMHMLNELDKEQREYFVSALNREVRSRRLTVDNAWVNQARVEELDGVTLAAQYKELAGIAESWGEEDLQIDCICAQAVLLDEYANGSEEALVLLDETIRNLGDDHRLLRRRQVVLVNQGRHEEALEALPRIIDGFSYDSVDFLYSLRDAGRSAFETGKLTESVRYFCEAAEVAANRLVRPLIPMSAGLLGDAAFVAFTESDYSSCLDFLKQATIQAETIGPEPTDLEKYCLIILGNFNIWMLEQIERGAANREWKPGICSNPNPHPEIFQSNVPPPLILWYQLANLETRLGIDVGALAELRARLKETGIGYFAFESVLSDSKVYAAIKKCDAVEFLKVFPEFLTLSTMSRPSDASVPTALATLKLPIVPIEQKHWNDNDKCLFFFENTIIAFALQAIACDKEPELDSLVNTFASSFAPDTKLGSFLKSLDEIRMFQAQGLSATGASCVPILREAKTRISADMALGLTYYVWGWLVQSQFKTCLENNVADCVSLIWRRIITENRFMLRNPAMTVPQIESVLDGPTKGAERLAALALETETATTSHLNEDIRQGLRQFLKNAKE